MTLKQALMNGQSMTSNEANEAIEEMKDLVYEGENPEEVLYDFGHEPDYIFEII